MPGRRLRRCGYDASPQAPEYRGFPGLGTESPAAGAVRFPAFRMRAGHGFCRKRHFHFGFRAVNRLRPLRGARKGPGVRRRRRAMARSGRRGARGGGSRKTKRGGRHVMIVESPVKARTIGGYLGREYRVIATRGHVRDLPAKAGSVKPEDGFAMAHRDRQGAPLGRWRRWRRRLRTPRPWCWRPTPTARARRSPGRCSNGSRNEMPSATCRCTGSPSTR